MTIQQAFDLISPAAPFLSKGPSPATLPTQQPQYWADLGCGSGLFTAALARLLPAGSTVYGIDTHPTVRQQTIHSVGSTDKPTSIIPIKADFVKTPLDLPPLDGILMANSLHYVKNKPALIQKLRSHMHPISYDSLTYLFKDHKTQKLGERPSAYGLSNMYAALVRPR